MKLRYFVAAVIWIATVTATLESDSHGNWSNEKEVLDYTYEQKVFNNETKDELKCGENQSPNQHERIFSSSKTDKPIEVVQEEALAVKFINRNKDNYEVIDPQQQSSKQIIQPYVLSLNAKNVPENTSKELHNTSKSGRISQNDTNETVIVEYAPSEEILVQDSSTTPRYFSQESGFNDLGQTVSEENVDVENVGEFGQRVRFPFSLRQRSSENSERFRSKQPVDAFSSSEDHRKQYRKSFRSYASKKSNNTNNSNFNVFSKERLSFALAKPTEPQRILKQKETEGDSTDNPIISKNASSFTSAPIVSVSLGKFSGPIVVPNLPRQKKYSFTTTTDYTESNEVSKPTAASVEAPKPEALENSYLAASSVVLNPLQVGIALMNAGQDLNSVNDHVALTKVYPQDETESPQTTDIHSESLIQSDAPDSGNSSFQIDQESQQEQTSEVVVSNSPVQSVEIQKSVEIFHTAPVQEIHYPVEFVPHIQQPLVNQRLQEDHRKPARGQYKDQRQGQVNVYRSNEILDEGILSNSQERSRYEYNTNENDIIYSASNSQINQDQSVVRPVENKPIFGLKEQVDSAQYDQTLIKYPRVQGISETSIKQGNYELPKGTSSIIAQPPRGVDNLSGLANIENFQGTPEVPQILVTKATNEPPGEMRLLSSVPQTYPVEKNVHVPHSVDVIEKKVPFPVEKVIEKQITIPQPFPVHVPIDRIVEKQIRIPYPVHVEKVVEKKVPFAIQRFIIPLPIHFRVPQPVPVPVEKIVEKPVPVPVPVEKVVEKAVHLARPYSIEIEKSRPYSLESTKFVKPGPIYNGQNDGNYQQVIRQNFQVPLEPPYGIDSEQGYYNSTMQFYGPGYLTLNRPHARQPLIHTLPKKFGFYGTQYPPSVTYSVNNGNLVTYGRISEKDKLKDEYVGPVPRKVQTSLGIQSKSLYSSQDGQTTLRRTRQESVGNTGSFRQSKMEYGFKPPMVPSVQYDEQTATKVE